jgi:hypothetical protein
MGLRVEYRNYKTFSFTNEKTEKCEFRKKIVNRLIIKYIALVFYRNNLLRYYNQEFKTINDIIKASCEVDGVVFIADF